MIAESPPLFTPSGKGFKAHYALSFSSDLVHLVYLRGDIQGAGVEAKTLLVDNTANSSVCTLNLRGRNVMIAPYSQQYVDCSGAPDIVVTGGSATATVSLDVLTYAVTEQTIVKKTLNVGGLPPIGIAKLNQLIPTNVPTKVLSIGDPVTSFVDLSSTGTCPNLYWGFNSNCSSGVIAINNSYHISMSCDSQELWVKPAGDGQGAYSLIGG
jgi:hypothetical protein